MKDLSPSLRPAPDAKILLSSILKVDGWEIQEGTDTHGRNRQKEGRPGLVCKVDFEKYFDNINWNCVDLTLAKFGFGHIWRSWTKWCILYARFAVLINGEATELFKSQKGIRQGDPISPFLFILITEVLSLMIKKAAASGLLSGFKVAQHGTVVNHLQFVDDLIVFLDDSEEQVANLKNIFLAFEIISGLKVNFRKSAIAGIGVDHNGASCADIFGCSLATLPINYLGIPFSSKSKCKSVWDIIIQRVCRFRKKDATVSQMINEYGAWDLDFRRNLKEEEVGEVALLLQVIGKPLLSADNDQWQWKHKDFSVANCYSTLDLDGYFSFSYKQIWNARVPLKVSFLVWTLCHKGAPTLDYLYRAGKVQNPDCLFCATAVETSDHLFLHCREAAKLWSYFLDSLDCAGPSHKM
ncbi:uncharacterized protein LOC113345474 [Papaver somniferum]|uniref:uncharacterized protein LOC113345474 n=1 Tax=Papaver somniferum TaxID=3469 RepID=UPI000E6F6257|nr:uncharacterized protein LOC113345474 [Papaver somniferum]